MDTDVNKSQLLKFEEMKIARVILEIKITMDVPHRKYKLYYCNQAVPVLEEAS